jgi:hypothetical protein
MRGFIEKILSAGYNTLRVGSETEWRSFKPQAAQRTLLGNMWAHGYLPHGPPVGSAECQENLKRLLKVTATYPNLWVQLISSFTCKDGWYPFRKQKDWARYVGNKARKYKHVFLSAMNEPTQDGYTYGEIQELVNILRQSGRPVGVDYPCEGGRWRYPRQMDVDYIDFHPRRNPDLSLGELENVVGLNGLSLFSETTSYASDENIQQWPHLGNHSNIYNEGHGTEEDRKRFAKNYLGRFKKVRRARWFFHSVDLIRWGAEYQGDFWIPRWR